jgi:hypothetical protein
MIDGVDKAKHMRRMWTHLKIRIHLFYHVLCLSHDHSYLQLVLYSGMLSWIIHHRYD